MYLVSFQVSLGCHNVTSEKSIDTVFVTISDLFDSFEDNVMYVDGKERKNAALRQCKKICFPEKAFTPSALPPTTMSYVCLFWLA